MTTLKSIIGKQGVDYNQNIGTIIAAVRVCDFEDIEQHDSSGWLDEDSIKEYELEPTDILVAFDIEGEAVNVYTFGGGGVELL